MRRHPWLRRMGAALCAAGVLAGAFCAVSVLALPDTFYITPSAQQQGLALAAMPWLQVKPNAAAAQQANTARPDRSENVTLALLGVLPLKTVRTVAVERRTVQVCGTPFGVKLFADGALVVAFSDQYTALGTENPAKQAGLRLGDRILQANGVEVRNNTELAEAIQAAQGQPLMLVYERNREQHTTSLRPVQDRTTGAWRAGVWVRDSSAGIGTMTFIDPERGTFAGLGHAISDSDTGAQVKLLSGEIVPVSVTGCVGGAAGAPGELHGEFSAQAAGTVLANDTTGVYGQYTGVQCGQPMPVAHAQEVRPGPAQLWCTLQGQQARAYSVRIERVDLGSADPNRNLVVRVVDPALLEACGGIVQGMSGSPLTQNGQLVGAVTHVLVNDPARGYGIFAETMLQKADALAAQDKTGSHQNLTGTDK